MDDLIAQIRAAIDEDERVALEASGYGDYAQTGWGVISASPVIAMHIARQDPARVLRQAEAHRKLLQGHDDVHRCDWGEHRGGDFGPCSTVLILADAYGIEVAD